MTETTPAPPPAALKKGRLETAWDGPGTRPWRRFTWKQWLESLVFPSRYQRIRMTLPGLMLILLTLGVGTAAYNASNNLLFLTLALLLACLIMSGVVSWINFRDIHWRLCLTPPLRAGASAAISIEVLNTNGFFPAHCLFFDVSSGNATPPTRLFLKSGLPPQSSTSLEWHLRPERRGRENLVLRYVGSNFPFGFLSKSLVADTRLEVCVWPASIAYAILSRELLVQGAGHHPHPGAGQSGDLRSLRDYRAGDAQRDIHWKASARSRRLVVREYASEANEGLEIWLHTQASLWPRPAQFETLCRLAATLAEDLFLQGNLTAFRIDFAPPIQIRGLHDLERCLDELALLQPSLRPALETNAAHRSDRVLTFRPEGPERVAAWLHGKQAIIA